MTNGWGGADPTQASDDNAYELGTVYHANVAVTISAIRVWAGSNPAPVSGRQGRIWTTGGTLLASHTLADNLPPGWSTYNLTSPLAIAAGADFVVSYSTGGRYGALVGGLTTAVDSSDGSLTAVADSAAAHGNGAFVASPGSFPNQDSGGQFYGIDVVFSTGSGGGPTINALTVAADATGHATATIAATGGGAGLAGATYSVRWGDGQQTLGSSSSVLTHTYAASGEYAVLGWVTDTSNLSDYAAAAVDVQLPTPGVVALDIPGILSRIEDHALSLGLFEAVNGNEPRSAPSTSGLTAAVWVGDLQAVAPPSGLDSTAALLPVYVRLYAPMVAEPYDQIETQLLNAVSALFGAYIGDLDLGSQVHSIDVKGAYSGMRLQAPMGYLTIDAVTYRVSTITLPIITDDAWTEVA